MSGGTQFIALLEGGFEGLSPRERGNPPRERAGGNDDGSIPA